MSTAAWRLAGAAMLLLLAAARVESAEEKPSDQDQAFNALIEMLRPREQRPEILQYFLIFVGITVVVLVTFGVLHKYWHVLFPERPARRRWDEASERRSVASYRPAFATAARSSGTHRVAPAQATTAAATAPAAPRAAAKSVEAPPARAPMSLASSQLLELDQELDLFGTGTLAGYCLRAVLVHRDAGHLLVKVDESVPEFPWKAGDTLQAYFWRENEAGYLFLTEIREVRRNESFFLVLSQPTQLERKQKRLHVRTPYRQPLRFQVISNAEVTQRVGAFRPVEQGPIDGWTEDLSAGGFRLLCNRQLSVGDYLAVEKFHPAGGEAILGRVVNSFGAQGGGRYTYGVSFAGISSRVREQIIREVFRLQREIILKARAIADSQAAGRASV